MTEERTAYRASKGGKRPGAGRKTNASKGLETRKMKSVRLAPWLITWLDQQPNQTAAIEEALIGFYGLQRPEE